MPGGGEEEDILSLMWEGKCTWDEVDEDIDDVIYAADADHDITNAANASKTRLDG